ncbi:hypothetical protein CC79DRAFT_1354999 [Sarocladium strictum]
MDKIPLNYEASEGDCNKQNVTTLPQEVVQCLENARFLHLATCSDNVPQVSLMNYTYLPSSPYSTSPVIVMTTNAASRKITNIVSNPLVSLLVHDWVSHRPPTHGRRLSGGSPPPEPPSSLASLLLNLNTAAVSSISATIGGAARLAPAGSAEERYLREQHLENNTYDESSGDNTGQAQSAELSGSDVKVIVVDIKDVRISDFKGNVRDLALVSEGTAMVNGSS